MAKHVLVANTSKEYRNIDTKKTKKDTTDPSATEKKLISYCRHVTTSLISIFWDVGNW